MPKIFHFLKTKIEIMKTIKSAKNNKLEKFFII